MKQEVFICKFLDQRRRNSIAENKASSPHQQQLSDSSETLLSTYRTASTGRTSTSLTSTSSSTPSEPITCPAPVFSHSEEADYQHNFNYYNEKTWQMYDRIKKARIQAKTRKLITGCHESTELNRTSEGLSALNRQLSALNRQLSFENLGVFSLDL